MSKQCQKVCGYCKNNHHIAICGQSRYNTGKNVPAKQQNSGTATKDKTQTTEGAKKTLSNHNQNSGVLLQTAQVKVVSSTGQEAVVNVLFDKGSQRSYVTTAICTKLQIPIVRRQNLQVNTFGNFDSQIIESGLAKVPMRTLHGNITIPMWTVPTICDKIKQFCSAKNNLNLKGLDLTNANIDGEIDVLIGCDVYWELVTGEVVNHHKGLVAMNSVFGWLVSGRNEGQQNNGITHTFICSAKDDIDVLDDALRQQDSDLSEEPTLKEFETNIRHNGERYVVCLPWRVGIPVEDNLYSLAYSRLINLKKKLYQTNTFDPYNDIIKSYLEKNYIEHVTQDQGPSCYLPHHGVTREDKVTTKLRIVFDGSAKVKGGHSLNECLYKGPTLLNDLVQMLTRFRIGSYVVSADIQEAFLQIELDERERNFTKFLWFKADNQIVCYRFRCSAVRHSFLMLR